MKFIIGLTLATALHVFGFAAQAQDAPEGFAVGGIGIASVSPYVGEHDTTAALPLLAWNSDAFSVSTAEGLRLTVFNRADLRFSVVVSPRFSAIDSSDSSALAGMEREITADAGLLVELTQSDTFSLSFRAVTEATDQHNGQEISVSARQMLRIGNVPIILGGGLDWQSDDLAEYIYGVRSSEATTTRPEYAPGDVLAPYVSVGTMIPVNDRMRIIGSLKAEFLPDNVTDSPIIDEDIVTSVSIGAVFNF
jgi:MipA family protein